MYDPSVGRWLQQDPIRFDAGDYNLTRYVGNDATNATDPTGLALFAYSEQTAKEYLAWLKGNTGDGPDAGKYGAITKLYPSLSPKLKTVGVQRVRDGKWVFTFDESERSTIESIASKWKNTPGLGTDSARLYALLSSSPDYQVDIYYQQTQGGVYGGWSLNSERVWPPSGAVGWVTWERQLAATPVPDALRKQTAERWSRIEDRLQTAPGISKQQLEDLKTLLGPIRAVATIKEKPSLLDIMRVGAVMDLIEAQLPVYTGPVSGPRAGGVRGKRQAAQ